MYHILEKTIQSAFREKVSSAFGSDADITLEQPRQTSFGEVALPIAFQLARALKQNPKKIAADLVEAVGPIPGVASMEIAGNGYINVRFDRGAFWMARHGLQMFYGRAAWRDEKGDPEVIASWEKAPSSSSAAPYPEPLGPPRDPTERAGPAPLIRAKYAWLATTRQLYRMLHHVGVREI